MPRIILETFQKLAHSKESEKLLTGIGIPTTTRVARTLLQHYCSIFSWCIRMDTLLRNLISVQCLHGGQYQVY